MIWLKHSAGLDTETMREIADNAAVSWSAESIRYRGRGIGYKNGDSTDATAIQDAAESILGYRPVVIDGPPEPDSE